MHFNILYPLFILFAVVHAAPSGVAPSSAGLNQGSGQAASSGHSDDSALFQKTGTPYEQYEVLVKYHTEGERAPGWATENLNTLFFHNPFFNFLAGFGPQTHYTMIGEPHVDPVSSDIEFQTVDRTGPRFEVKMNKDKTYDEYSVYDLRTGKRILGKP
ncbi:hypothetical protein F5878DRAFT_286301 [Lentinula raphanica]|uniref:Uncharacterized protein n=1 Tax=Lentinula raphanica TaxID=153919 RepID=A0AA38UBT9_9AGAR|nr:hypothetical protein F5878DRAFT_286301 [Lentinula raphanica]